MRHYAIKCPQAPADGELRADLVGCPPEHLQIKGPCNGLPPESEKTVGAWLKHRKLRKNNCILPHKQALFGWDRFELNTLC